MVGLIGMLIERFALRPLYGRGHLDQALVTFGFLLIIYDARRLIWGTDSKFVPPPPSLSGTVEILGFSYSMYNLFVIAFGAVLVAATWALLNYTKFGLIIRAGSQDRKMVGDLGIDINRYYTLLFGFGMALAGIGGVTLGAYQSVDLDMGHSIIIPAFVIVVIGGLKLQRRRHRCVARRYLTELHVDVPPVSLRRRNLPDHDRRLAPQTTGAVRKPTLGSSKR